MPGSFEAWAGVWRCGGVSPPFFDVIWDGIKKIIKNLRAVGIFLLIFFIFGLFASIIRKSSGSRREFRCLPTQNEQFLMFF